jgi:hypothetical protein
VSLVVEWASAILAGIAKFLAGVVKSPRPEQIIGSVP